MSTFEDATSDFDGAALPPPRVVKLPLGAWVSTYSCRPECDVSIGIRLPGQGDADAIELEAVRAMHAAAVDGEDAAEKAYNETKLRTLVALCICDPLDATQPHELFDTPNAILQIALTPQGLRRLFDEIERLQIETSPIFREADDEDFALLHQLFSDGRLAELPPAEASRVRRLVAYCVEILTDG